MLATSADSIHEGLQIGDVYVHCKAGQGRSAQSILAYLMKHEHETVDQAILHMQQDRPNITLKTRAKIDLMTEGSKRRRKEEERYNFFESFSNLCPKPKATQGVAMVLSQVGSHDTVTI